MDGGRGQVSAAKAALAGTSLADVPLYCIETPLSSLTEEDRRLLARGIRAETLSEACKLIEDYE